MNIFLSIVIGIMVGVLGYHVYMHENPNANQIDMNALIFKDDHKHFTKDLEKPEGRLLQEIDNLDDEIYKSTEGNQAQLYKIHEGCEILVSIYGETFFSERKFRFLKHSLRSLKEIEYRTSWMERVNYDPEQKEKSLYRVTRYDIDSNLSQEEFKNILTKFDPEHLKRC